MALKRRWLCICITLLLLTGCSLQAGEDLLRAPKPAMAYKGLYDNVRKLLSSGMEYAPPGAGDNRQNIQMSDLDGNGTEEALVFMKDTEGLHILVYVQREDEVYDKAAEMVLVGDSINTISYTDLNADNQTEVVVTYMVGQLKGIAVYTYYEESMTVIYEGVCTLYAITDITGDDVYDLLLINHQKADKTGDVTLLRYEDNLLEAANTAPLSLGCDELLRIVTGTLHDGRNALLINSKFERVILPDEEANSVAALAVGDMVTDILWWRDGKLENLLINGDTGVSEEAVRSNARPPINIDDDDHNIIELPITMTLPLYSETSNERYLLQWKSYSSSGKSRLVTTTYHTTASKWYMVIPEAWIKSLTVSVQTMTPKLLCTTFARYNGEGQAPTDMVRVYTHTVAKGETVDRTDRILLGEISDKVILAEIIDNSIDPQMLIDNFYTIQTEWPTGVQP